MGLFDWIGNNIIKPIMGDPHGGTRDALAAGAGRYTQGGQNLDQLGQMFMQQAQGQGPSVAQQQLRQGLSNAVAGQHSFANSARPGQSGMALRMAMQNVGNLQAKANQDAALMRAMEMQQARESAGNLFLQGRAQDLQAAGASTGMKTPGQRFGQMAMDYGPAILGLASDRRLKKNIKDGGKDADALLDALKAHSYDYKDEKYGKGNQLGVMAQVLERVPGGKQAIVNTPQGKMVDTAKLTGALAAALGRVNERLSAVEGKKAV